MPDISMCNDPDCPFSRQCYRHPDSGTKPDPYRQAWGFFEKIGPPVKPENCKGYIKRER